MDNDGIMRALGELPPETIISEASLAAKFKRHPSAIKRAVKRGELPPPVRLMGKPSWTVGAILTHMERRLEAARQEAQEEADRIDRLSL